MYIVTVLVTVHVLYVINVISRSSHLSSHRHTLTPSHHHTLTLTPSQTQAPLLTHTSQRATPQLPKSLSSQSKTSRSVTPLIPPLSPPHSSSPHCLRTTGWTVIHSIPCPIIPFPYSMQQFPSTYLVTLLFRRCDCKISASNLSLEAKFHIIMFRGSTVFIIPLLHYSITPFPFPQPR